MLEKIFTIKKLSEKEWVIICVINIFNIPIWDITIDDNGFPFYNYYQVKLEHQFLERLEKRTRLRNNLILLFLIILICLHYAV